MQMLCFRRVLLSTNNTFDTSVKRSKSCFIEDSYEKSSAGLFQTELLVFVYLLLFAFLAFSFYKPDYNCYSNKNYNYQNPDC